MLRTLLVISIFLTRCSHSLVNETIVIDFFKIKYCRVGTILNCATKKEQIEQAKYFIQNDLEISFFNIEKNISCEYALTRTRTRTQGLAVIIDAECDNSESLMKECAELRFFYSSFHWLAFGTSSNVTKKFENVALVNNADLNVIVPNNDENNQWDILDVYNPSYKHGGQLRVELVGYYNERDGYTVKYTGAKHFKRRNMTGTLFKAAMVALTMYSATVYKIQPPKPTPYINLTINLFSLRVANKHMKSNAKAFTSIFHVPENISITLEQYLAKEDERYNNTFSRFQSVIVKNCNDFFNFTINASQVNSWGYEQPNGEVDGLVRALQDKKVDFGIAALMFRLYRLKRLDFSSGNWVLRSAFIFRHPKSTSSSYELFLRPLVTSVWIATLLTLIIMVLILRLAVTKETQVLSTKDSGNASWNFLILYGIGEICQQGFSYVPILPSGRIVIFIVLIFSFLIYQFYSASLVSSLLLQPPHTITSLLDLINSPLKASCENSLFDMDYFNKSTDPLVLSLYNKKIKSSHNNSNFLPPDEGLKMIQSGGSAYHAQISSAYPIITKTFPEKFICELAEVEMYPTQYTYMSIQKKSPLKQMFDYCTTYQREVGVSGRIRKLWEAPRPVCLDATNYMEITVSLEESYWALVLLGLGMMTSLLILAVEHLWAMKRNALKNFCKKQKKDASRPARSRRYWIN